MDTAAKELIERAEAIMSEEKWSEAINLLEAQPYLIEHDFALSWDLGWAYFKLADYESAESHLARATELQPRSAVAWWALGEAQRHAGRLVEAERNLKEALRLKDGTIGRLSLAIALMERGKWAEAELVHLKGLELEPESADRWQYYASFLEDAGRMLEAAEAHKKVRRLAGN
jgi:predicted Zn-dependent protease